MSDDLEEFLNEIGFSNIYGLLIENQIATLKALKGLDEESFKEIGLKPAAIRSIMKQLNSQSNNLNSSYIQNQGQGSIGGGNDDVNNNQLILFRKEQEIVLLRKDTESERKFTEMQHQLELMKIGNENRAALQEAKTKGEIDSLKQTTEFLKKESELNAKIIEKEHEGKLKVLEVKLENAQKAPPTQSPVIVGSGVYPYGYPYGYPPFAFPADSIVLNAHFYGLIQGWLGSPRHWVLRYRGTRNGFGSANFHALCNNVGPTVTIIRSTGGYFFGGYNPNSWTSCSNYQPGNGSFIFTLTNPYGSLPTPFYYKGSYGPYDHSNYGPTFGNHDIYVSNNCNSNNSSYTNLPLSYNDTLGYGKNTFTGAFNFTVSDIEVFSV